MASINNGKIAYAREMLLGAKPARDDVPCTTCDIYLKMRKDDHWLERNPTRAATPARIDDALLRARRLYDIGRLSEAAQIYHAMLAAKPDSGEALYGLGLVAYELGHQEAAVNYLRRALVQRPGDRGISQLLGKALAAEPGA